MQKFFSLFLTTPLFLNAINATSDTKSSLSLGSYTPGQHIAVIEDSGMGFIAANDNKLANYYTVENYTEEICSKTGDKKRIIHAYRNVYTLVPGFPLYRYSIILEQTCDAHGTIKTGAGAPGGPGDSGVPFVINVHRHSGNAVMTVVVLAGITGIVYKLCNAVQDLRNKYAELQS